MKMSGFFVIAVLILAGCPKGNGSTEDGASERRASADDCRLRLQSINFGTTSYGSGLNVQVGRDCMWYMNQYGGGYGMTGSYGYSTLYGDHPTLMAVYSARQEHEMVEQAQAVERASRAEVAQARAETAAEEAKRIAREVKIAKLEEKITSLTRDLKSSQGDQTRTQELLIEALEELEEARSEETNTEGGE